MNKKFQIPTNIAKGICKFVIVTAIFMMIGTVGGYENNTMTFLQLCAFFVLHLATIVIASVGYAFVEYVEEELIEQRRMRRRMRKARLEAIRERELRKQRFEDIKQNAEVISFQKRAM